MHALVNRTGWAAATTADDAANDADCYNHDDDDEDHLGSQEYGAEGSSFSLVVTQS